MATAKEIEKVILKLAGNPVAGPVKEMAREWAEAIVELDEPKVKRATIKPEETR